MGLSKIKTLDLLISFDNQVSLETNCVMFGFSFEHPFASDNVGIERDLNQTLGICLSSLVGEGCSGGGIFVFKGLKSVVFVPPQVPCGIRQGYGSGSAVVHYSASILMFLCAIP